MGPPSGQKSNTELIKSLRTRLEAAKDAAAAQSTDAKSAADYRRWTSVLDRGTTLCIPALPSAPTGLQEEREQYDITLKLFFAPDANVSLREAQTREAIDLVTGQLGVTSVDLLIVSFPGVSFDESNEDDNKNANTVSSNTSCNLDMQTYVDTWRSLEQLHDQGSVTKIGVSEFGVEILQPFLQKVRIAPAVDQVNLRDCCTLPTRLMALAKANDIEILVHNDCSNILPRGTIRDLLGTGPGGVSVLADVGSSHAAVSGADRFASPLTGDVQPQWVIKYTAVVKNRGVVENKGYFASALVAD